MCGRYAATLPPEMMVELFNLLNSVDYPPRYNIKPTEPIVTIREKDGQRTAYFARWGLVPAWVKDPRDFPLLINARADSMVEKPAFRDAMKWKRCVIPASGYYEWMVGPDGAKRPYYITRADEAPMAFAGLYATWTGPEGEKIDSAAIVTVDPNLDISDVHDRMPAVLPLEEVGKWLDTEHVGPKEAAALARTPPLGTMKYHVVARRVGSADAEGPELIRPLTPEEVAADTPAPRGRKRAAGSGQLDLF
jgi:putative SOS response-associated peptidase YedK